MPGVIVGKPGYHNPHTSVSCLGLRWWQRMMVTHVTISLMRKKRQTTIMVWRPRMRVAKVAMRRTSMLLVSDRV